MTESNDYEKDKSTHPIQPLELDADSTVRFKSNAIVKYLYDSGAVDLNKLALLKFPNDDRQHFAQLIGYSFDGYCSLSYAHPDICLIAEYEAIKLKSQIKNTKGENHE